MGGSGGEGEGGGGEGEGGGGEGGGGEGGGGGGGGGGKDDGVSVISSYLSTAKLSASVAGVVGTRFECLCLTRQSALILGRGVR